MKQMSMLIFTTSKICLHQILEVVFDLLGFKTTCFKGKNRAGSSESRMK
jgi:hypothetical protein